MLLPFFAAPFLALLVVGVLGVPLAPVEEPLEGVFVAFAPPAGVVLAAPVVPLPALSFAAELGVSELVVLVAAPAAVLVAAPVPAAVLVVLAPTPAPAAVPVPAPPAALGTELAGAVLAGTVTVRVIATVPCLAFDPASDTSAALNAPSDSTIAATKPTTGRRHRGVAASRVRAAAPQRKHHCCPSSKDSPHSGQRSAGSLGAVPGGGGALTLTPQRRRRGG
jgi:hypothetical protein